MIAKVPEDGKDLAEEEEKALREYVDRSEASMYCFIRGLVIPSAAGPRLFDEIMADWQRECFEELALQFEAVKVGKKPDARRWWIERTKKASKDTDIAACLLWLIAFSDRPILVQVSAANSEQARIIEDRASELLYYNPWLNDRVEIVSRLIRSRELPKTCRCRIEATGTAGAAQGPTPDVLVLNELVHVERWGTMQAHMNNADGVPRGLVIIATNAGIKGTPAEKWRKNAESSDRWQLREFRGRAPWLSEEDVEDARRRDPIGAEFQRLWKGVWISGTGGAVSQEAIDACFRAEELKEPEPGWIYLGGMDLGVKRDHAAIACVGVNQKEQLVRIAQVQSFAPDQPTPDGHLEVDVRKVRRAAKQMHKTFRLADFGYDPAAGGSFIAQDLRREGLPMREHNFGSPSVQTEMATAYVLLTQDGRLIAYEDVHGMLRRDFGKFSIKHTPPSKYKLEAVSDEFGHADVGIAVVICLPQALQMIGWSATRLQPDDDVAGAWDGDDELSEEEIEAMPGELREIIEGEDEDTDERGFGSKPGWADF